MKQNVKYISDPGTGSGYRVSDGPQYHTLYYYGYLNESEGLRISNDLRLV